MLERILGLSIQAVGRDVDSFQITGVRMAKWDAVGIFASFAFHRFVAMSSPGHLVSYAPRIDVMVPISNVHEHAWIHVRKFWMLLFSLLHTERHILLNQFALDCIQAVEKLSCTDAEWLSWVERAAQHI